MSGVKLKEKIAELLKIVGLEEAEDIPVERYSKGMKQRLQIARGLINDPEYIFLDEPTLGLDIVIAKEIRTMIKELAQERKKGVLLTTHYISEAEELCDYIYVLDKGRMIAQGTKEELKDLFASNQKMVCRTWTGRNIDENLFTDQEEKTVKKIFLVIKAEIKKQQKHDYHSAFVYLSLLIWPILGLLEVYYTYKPFSLTGYMGFLTAKNYWLS